MATRACRSPVSAGNQMGVRSPSASPWAAATLAPAPRAARPRLARRRRSARSASTMMAGMTKTRWWLQEIGLTTLAVNPTRVNAASSSPSACALAARDSPTTATTSENVSQSRVGASAESYIRASTPASDWFGVASAVPTRSVCHSTLVK